jgi:anti-anti-sigma factor
MAITSKISDDQQEVMVTVEGRFDFNALRDFRKAYESQPKAPRYVLDFAKTEYLDSSALGMLLALRDYAGGDKSNIRVMNTIPDVKKILVITKLDGLFKIE